MKKAIVHYIVLLLVACCSFNGLQAQLSPGLMVEGTFDNENKKFIGEVLTVTDKQFTCRFVHSGAVYTFQRELLKGDPTMIQNSHGATVISAGGGKYKKGARFHFLAWMPYQDGCHFSQGASAKDLVIVKFADGRSFLGDMVKHEYDYYVTFRHSGSLYIFDIYDVVTKSGGAYPKGSKATISCTVSVPQAKFK